MLAGTICGITFSYTLGRTFGLALIHRFGKYIHLTEERLAKAHAFFERVGHWSLTFGYFVPGVRHLTAYAAGVSYVQPHIFAVFAYFGALLWATTFMSLGYFLGDRWQVVFRPDPPPLGDRFVRARRTHCAVSGVAEAAGET